MRKFALDLSIESDKLILIQLSLQLSLWSRHAGMCSNLVLDGHSGYHCKEDSSSMIRTRKGRVKACQRAAINAVNWAPERRVAD
jgi:hypothetical protein